MTVYHRILADERRRTAIDVLDEQPAMTLDELAEAIVDRDELTVDPHAVKVSLHHVHAPLLDDVGAIDYDQIHELITPVRPVLDEVVELKHTVSADPPDGRREVVL